MSEQWRPIPGYEGRYEVSELGRVRSWRPWRGTPVPRLLRGSLGTHGYRGVTLYGFKGARQDIAVHLLMLTAFVGPEPDGMVTRHLDGDKTNNILTNLAYGTPSENARDAVAHGVNPWAARTHCPQGHPYDEANTYRWRSVRACRVCRAAADARRKTRRRLLRAA